MPATSSVSKASARQRTLVFIVGPPAVGKMTVGQALGSLTGLALFHNHLSIEAVLPVFDYGTPAFNRIVGMIRREILSEAVSSELPGIIFTFVWAFDHPGEVDYVRSLVEPFEAGGGRVVFVELWADLETRLARNETDNRLTNKASKRDVAASRARLIKEEESWQFCSDGDFPLEPHLFIDNSALEPDEVARQIAGYFDLPLSQVDEAT